MSSKVCILLNLQHNKKKKIAAQRSHAVLSGSHVFFTPGMPGEAGIFFQTRLNFCMPRGWRKLSNKITYEVFNIPLAASVFWQLRSPRRAETMASGLRTGNPPPGSPMGPHLARGHILSTRGKTWKRERSLWRGATAQRKR